MALLFPIGKVLFMPLAFFLTPFSTVVTWLSLNALGFYSVLQVPEIFYNNSGINVTFSCSGAGQIIFCITAMIIFNFCFPLKSIKFFLIQLFRSFLFTFSTNIIRLFNSILYRYYNWHNKTIFALKIYNIESLFKLDHIKQIFFMTINTFLLLLLVISNYTNLFLNIKNRRKWKIKKVRVISRKERK